MPFRPSVLKLCLLAAASLLPLVAHADERPSRTAQASVVRALLAAPHPRVDGEALRRIGPDVHALLVEHAAGEGQSQLRLRALGWLTYFPGPTSRAVLMEALRARDASRPVKRAVLRALPGAMGPACLEVVREHLQDRDLFVREAAAYALGDLDDRRVRAILVDRLGREPELAVRDALTASIAKVDERPTHR